MKSWRHAPRTLAPFVVSVLILGFQIASLTGACGTCATGVPTTLLILAGLAWLAVAFREFRGASSWTVHVAALLTSAHAAVILLAVHAACTLCWLIFVCECGAASWLYLSRQETGPWIIGSSTAGVLTGLVAFTVLWSPLGNRSLFGDTASDRIVYVLMQRDCGNCSAIEKRMREVVNDLGIQRVEFVDRRGEQGSNLSRLHKFTTFPSYLARLPGGKIVAQHGGGIETFLSVVKLSLAK